MCRMDMEVVNRLQDKATLFDHDFDLSEVKNLVRALQTPLAIFEYGDRSKAQNVIVPLQKDGKKFIVGLSLNPTVGGRSLEINSIRNVFPKDNSEWLNWINQGKALYIDKEKIQTLIDQQRTNLADVDYLDLDSVTKIVKGFVNPKISDENVADNGILAESDPAMYRDPGESIFDYTSRVSEDVERSVRERVSARDEYEKKVKSKGFQTKEALQNSMLGLQEFMLAIDHASGNRRHIEDIPDFENPILGENRLSSVNKEEMHQVAKTLFKPLMSAVAKLSGNGEESGELYDYMFAKHGLERDAVMRQREAQKLYNAAVDGRKSRAIESWQDEMYPVKKMQEAIEKATGKKTADFENAYLMENQLGSAGNATLDKYSREVVKPMNAVYSEMLKSKFFDGRKVG